MRQLREFNSALLGKWCWRMLVDGEGFWYWVLVAQYGEEAGRLGAGVVLFGGGKAKIRDGIGDIDGGWFVDRVSKRVGNGASTFFWHDGCLGEVSLRTRFSCLFYLTTNKLCTVADMFSLGWEEGGAAWSWRMRLWAWEKELVEECRHLRNDIVLQVDISDRWQWNPDIQGGYIVRGVYHILTTLIDPVVGGMNDLFWHKQVPMKVSIFAWRLIWDRLPTKTNLVRRGLLNSELAACGVGCGQEESALHMFLQVSNLMIFVSTSFSSFIVQVTQGSADPSFSFYGYFVSGWFGMNATTKYLIMSKPP